MLNRLSKIVLASALGLVLIAAIGLNLAPQANPPKTSDPVPAVQAAQLASPPPKPSPPATPSDPEPEGEIEQRERPADLAPGGILSVHFIDVGQGDSALIVLPDGRTVLIDAGEAPMAKPIIRYIEGLGVKELTWVIATHPHSDHIGGMAEVLNAFDIKNVSMPRTSHTTKTYENLLLTIKQKGLNVFEARAGRSLIDEPDLEALFLSPVAQTYDDLNDFSAVLLLRYHDSTFLFTGDATKLAEQHMLLSSIRAPRAQVLKVGHHGSRTSTSVEFLEVVSPEYAVISVGRGNSYGHPTAEVLARLDARAVEVYRTDRDGTVVMRSDGSNLTVETFGTAEEPVSVPAASVPTAAPEPVATPVSTGAPAAAPSETKSTTVYITKTGTKYHERGCRHLSHSSSAIELSEALEKGYEPCKVCNPPR